MKMNPPLDWLEECRACGQWCCRGEAPFASLDELARYGTEKIGQQANGACTFLDEQGQCRIHEGRPFECRIFPFDVQDIGGKLMWVVWDACEAISKLDWIAEVDRLENESAGKFSHEYVENFVRHHKRSQPEKYSERRFHVIRECRL